MPKTKVTPVSIQWPVAPSRYGGRRLTEAFEEGRSLLLLLPMNKINIPLKCKIVGEME